eukprot:gene18910-25469_t
MSHIRTSAAVLALLRDCTVNFIYTSEFHARDMVGLIRTAPTPGSTVPPLSICSESARPAHVPQVPDAALGDHGPFESRVLAEGCAPVTCSTSGGLRQASATASVAAHRSQWTAREALGHQHPSHEPPLMPYLVTPDTFSQVYNKAPPQQHLLLKYGAFGVNDGADSVSASKRPFSIETLLRTLRRHDHVSSPQHNSLPCWSQSTGQNLPTATGLPAVYKPKLQGERLQPSKCKVLVRNVLSL